MLIDLICYLLFSIYLAAVKYCFQLPVCTTCLFACNFVCTFVTKLQETGCTSVLSCIIFQTRWAVVWYCDHVAKFGAKIHITM